MYASVRSIPLLANFLTTQVRLTRKCAALTEERDAALAKAKVATDAAEAFEMSSDGWKSTVEQIGETVQELRAQLEAMRKEVAAARAEVAASRREVHAQRELLAQSIVYITGLHTFMRVGGNPPQMPEALRREIAAILENKALADVSTPLDPKQ